MPKKQDLDDLERGLLPTIGNVIKTVYPLILDICKFLPKFGGDRLSIRDARACPSFGLSCISIDLRRSVPPLLPTVGNHLGKVHDTERSILVQVGKAQKPPAGIRH